MDREDYTYSAALLRAAEILGGAVTLARALEVPMADLARWMSAQGRPPMGIFLKVVDILLEEDRRTKFVPLDPPAAQTEKPSQDGC